jgi:hypothetical protein
LGISDHIAIYTGCVRSFGCLRGQQETKGLQKWHRRQIQCYFFNLFFLLYDLSNIRKDFWITLYGCGIRGEFYPTFGLTCKFVTTPEISANLYIIITRRKATINKVLLDPGVTYKHFDALRPSRSKQPK